MSTRYVEESSEGYAPSITQAELDVHGREGALTLLQGRLKQHQRNLLNPKWKNARMFPNARPGWLTTEQYVAQYEGLNHKLVLTKPGFHCYVKEYPDETSPLFSGPELDPGYCRSGADYLEL